MNRPVKYLLVTAFIIAVMIIVFLQYNSNRSINGLIQGNDNLLNHIEVKTNLQRLQTHIIAYESKVRGTIISDGATDRTQIGIELQSVYNVLSSIDSLAGDTSYSALTHTLRALVDEKVSFNRRILDTFVIRGKGPAEQIIATLHGQRITDSIKTVCNALEELHERRVTALILEADDNGSNAKTIGTILAAIGVVSSIFIFIYISNRVRVQQQLIERLNLSERKAKDAAQVKENFLANMSHEIRTPLNAILGYTNILQRKKLDAESKQHIQTIQRSGENLLNIVNDVLDLSKIEAGMMRIEMAPFSIRGLVQSVEAMFSPKANEKNLALTSNVGELVPDIIEGDATRLTQILVNLVGNSVKFTSQGHVMLRVDLVEQEDDRVVLRMTVGDTGIGISKQKLESIFDRFQQAEDAVTRKYGGTGLGLSIVQELVELQQGSVKAVSEEGIGTAIQVTIPYKVANNPNIQAKEEIFQPVNDQQMSNARLLVVEDNEINQHLIHHLFSEWQLTFDLAKNGREAIEMVKKNNYSLVLMDIQMPDIDGYSATEYIRKTLELDIPIVAMTAHAMPREREKCIEAGMNDYLPKPLREEELCNVIRRFVNTAEVGKEAEVADAKSFNIIDLRYMKEISSGNTQYEKTVTEQFIESIPADLAAIDTAWKNGRIEDVQHIAHNLKTSVSVMGLNERLQPYLDGLEYSHLDEKTFHLYYPELKRICELAVAEARVFYHSLTTPGTA